MRPVTMARQPPVPPPNTQPWHTSEISFMFHTLHTPRLLADLVFALDRDDPFPRLRTIHCYCAISRRFARFDTRSDPASLPGSRTISRIAYRAPIYKSRIGRRSRKNSVRLRPQRSPVAAAATTDPIADVTITFVNNHPPDTILYVSFGL